MLIKTEDCCLLVIDVQERLIPVMYDPAGVVSGCRSLLAAAREVGIPVLFTEHYPAGIGPTAGALADLVAPGEVAEKIHFSCFSEPSLRRRIRATGRRTLVLAGIEAHVCLGQSALDLNAAGYHVIVPPDATGSRTRLDHETALFRLAREGAAVVGTGAVRDAWRAAALGTIAGQDIGQDGGRAGNASRVGLP